MSSHHYPLQHACTLLSSITQLGMIAPFFINNQWQGDVTQCNHPFCAVVLRQQTCKQVCTMTNGSREVTQKFLDRSKLDFVSPVLDVEGPRAWKPCRAAYQYVLDQLGLQREAVSSICAHAHPGKHMEVSTCNNTTPCPYCA